MDVNEARDAIEEILASIPDSELPEFDRVELTSDGKPCVWWGGTGFHLGSARRNGKRDPMIYRSRGSWDAIHAEMTYRADKALLENGDDPSGVRLAREAVNL